MSLPDSDGVSRAPPYLGDASRKSLLFSPTGLSPSMAGLSRPLRLREAFVTSRRFRRTVRCVPTTPAAQRRRAITRSRFGLIPVRSPLLGESRLLSFPRGTEMCHFPRFASAPYAFRCGCWGISPSGFLHSGIPGSQPGSGSPGLFAATHALHRLSVPRHPPCALSSLTAIFSYTPAYQ